MNHKSKPKEFRKNVKNSSLSGEERRKLLFECFDILFAIDPKKESYFKKK